MSVGELRAYHGQLAAFNSRANNYVPGDRGTPIPRALWQRYQSVEKAANEQADRFESNLRLAKEKIPTLGRTATGYLADRENIDRSKGGGQYRTFEKVSREPGDIAGPGQLGKLIGGLEKQLDPKYLAKRMREQRRNIKTMLETAGASDLYGKIGNMPNEQLMLLIDHTDFMNRLGGVYAWAKANKNVEETPEWQSEAAAEYSLGMQENLDWARRQPRIDGSSRREYLDTSAKAFPAQQAKWTADDTRAGSIPVQQPARWNPNDTRAGAIPVQRPAAPKPGHDFNAFPRTGDYIASGRGTTFYQVVTPYDNGTVDIVRGGKVVNVDFKRYKNYGGSTGR
jgi:hypothetical protein